MENIIDFDRCMEAGALCSTELEFYKRFPLEAKASIMNGWHDEVCANMTVFNHAYTKEVCQATALLYTKRGEFRKYSRRIYDKACNAGWLNEVCSHMTGRIKRKAGWWDDIDRKSVV